MTQLRSFICLPQAPFWGIVFSRALWPLAAIVVGTVRISEIPQMCLNILNDKTQRNPDKAWWEEGETITILTFRVSSQGLRSVCILKRQSSILNLFIRAGVQAVRAS